MYIVDLDKLFSQHVQEEFLSLFVFAQAYIGIYSTAQMQASALTHFKHVQQKFVNAFAFIKRVSKTRFL